MTACTGHGSNTPRINRWVSCTGNPLNLYSGPGSKIITIQNEDDCLLGCCITLKMEAVSSSETSVNIYQTTRCYIPQDRIPWVKCSSFPSGLHAYWDSSYHCVVPNPYSLNMHDRTAPISSGTDGCGFTLRPIYSPGKEYPPAWKLRGPQKPTYAWNYIYYLEYRPIRIEVHMTVKTSLLVLWLVTPCGLLGRHRRFGRICCLHPNHEDHNRQVTLQLNYNGSFG
jgi:hypothetical protein